MCPDLTQPTARVYTAHYACDIAAVVLVEATHPEVLARPPAELAAGFTPPAWQLFLFDILGQVGVARARSEGSSARAAQHGHSPQPYHPLIGHHSELGAIPLSLAQARVAGDFGTTPLLLSAEATYVHHSQAEGIWDDLQQDLTTLSSSSTHQMVPGTTHESLVYSQAGARATIMAVLGVVVAAPRGQPLAP